jgi:hypothetical protein
MERTAGLVQQFLAVERELDRMRACMLVEHLPRAVSHAARAGARNDLKQLSNWRKQVTRSQHLDSPPDAGSEFGSAVASWNETVSRKDALHVAAQRSWMEEHESARAALWRLAADPRLLEAIWLSNPDVYRALTNHLQEGVAPQRSSAVRRIERSLISYVQRVCTKNETNSFFGPINYGHLDSCARRNVDYVRSATTVRRRTSFATQWMAEALATAMATDLNLLPHLKPRRGTRWRLRTPGVLEDTASGHRVPLDLADARLVCHADGTRTVDQLAVALDEDWRSTWGRVERLDRAGVLVARLLVPVKRADPLGYLLEWLSVVPPQIPGRDRWFARVARLWAQVEALSSDALPARIARLSNIEQEFAAATGSAPRRRDGAMYADRALVFEECLGDLERFVLGGTLAHTIAQRLQPVLRLWHTAARLRAEADQRAARRVWEHARLSSSEASVPLLRFLATAHRVGPHTDALDERLDDLRCQLGELVQARSDGHRARISSEELPPESLAPEPDACAYTSVDLLIDAPSEAALEAGDFRLVVGEAHAPPLLWVFPTAYYAREALGETVFKTLAAQPGAAIAAQVALARDTKIYPLELPGRDIELRPLDPECGALPASDVDVRADEGEAVSLWCGTERLRLYPPLKRRGTADPFAGLGFPGIEALAIETGEHTPRIEIDGVILQRERWRLPGGALGETGQRDFDLFVSASRWKRDHGLPDEVFVRVSNEPKPVYLDFRNQFLIEMFDHMAAQNNQLVVSEMLPSSSGTWLQGQGGHYSAEFRLVAVA